MQLRFSQDLEILLNRLADEPLTLEDILEQTAERGFGLVIALLVLPFMLPVPPGLTGFSGSACIILSLQMAMGRKFPWLPQKLKQMPFPKALSVALLQNIHRITSLFERITRTRLRTIARHPFIWRINGLVITWLAILLIAPIPFTNPIPTIGILLLVVAMLEADGLLMCFAYGLAAVITFACFSIAYMVWQSMGSFQLG
ncbi:exopolysaccharide biosynthesis protein [filamentous cyanobacterium LEGE 11480]|uniref:Exopolysaccharide biosynthesis protein n=1 Tax=Romeriopsis navalis LEGE 11480 TaxID=2777977 RepID=A0A928VMV1_9CYAN|nr:exopolysaccharide biosynthesis protein [Romeriopsis navalis]MBE9029410.1 exopolysaccharide biosynthesis protein [Romeriopsis navalis LEGE 11480]